MLSMEKQIRCIKLLFKLIGGVLAIIVAIAMVLKL